jgi:hypothetical protein
MKKLIVASMLLAGAATFVAANKGIEKTVSAVVNSDGSPTPPWRER